MLAAESLGSGGIDVVRRKVLIWYGSMLSSVTLAFRVLCTSTKRLYFAKAIVMRALVGSVCVCVYKCEWMKLKIHTYVCV